MLFTVQTCSPHRTPIISAGKLDSAPPFISNVLSVGDWWMDFSFSFISSFFGVESSFPSHLLPWLTFLLLPSPPTILLLYHTWVAMVLVKSRGWHRWDKEDEGSCWSFTPLMSTHTLFRLPFLLDVKLLLRWEESYSEDPNHWFVFVFH